jgi:hypothetical protein
VSDERLRSEVERLRHAVGSQRCGQPAPCASITASEVAVYDDGEELVAGAEPRPLCEGCPQRGSGRVRHVEVRRDLRS